MEEDDQKDRLVLEVVRKERPPTVKKLVDFIHERNPRLSNEDILATVERLRTGGELTLRPQRFKTYGSFLFSVSWNSALWVFLAFSLILGIITAIPLEAPLTLARLPFILVLFFYFPGRGVLRVLDPTFHLSGIERILLEFAISFVLVLLIGLILNFSGLGFFAVPATGTMISFGLILTLAASYRDFQATEVKN